MILEKYFKFANCCLIYYISICSIPSVLLNFIKQYINFHVVIEILTEDVVGNKILELIIEISIIKLVLNKATITAQINVL